MVPLVYCKAPPLNVIALVVFTHKTISNADMPRDIYRTLYDPFKKQVTKKSPVLADVDEAVHGQGGLHPVRGVHLPARAGVAGHPHGVQVGGNKDRREGRHPRAPAGDPGEDAGGWHQNA